MKLSDKIFSQIGGFDFNLIKNSNVCKFNYILDKKSKIRNWFETDRQLAVFPCYEDNDRTLISYVGKHLKGYKGLTGEITNLIIDNSNMDRRIIKSELIKIKDFFIKKKINKY